MKKIIFLTMFVLSSICLNAQLSLSIEFRNRTNVDMSFTYNGSSVHVNETFVLKPGGWKVVSVPANRSSDLYYDIHARRHSYNPIPEEYFFRVYYCGYIEQETRDFSSSHSIFMNNLQMGGDFCNYVLIEASTY